MRDLAFLGFLTALFGMGLRRPFLLVCAYVYIDVVSPQRLTYYLLNSVPISLIAVVLAVVGWAIADDKTDSRFAPRQALILLLLIYCGITTMTADFPTEALFKWDWAWKALAFAAFLPLTLRTRLRIETLLCYMIVSASAIIIVGGIKTLASGGGGYGELNLMVTDNTGMYESSIISMVAICMIPLILWFTKFGTIFPPDWKVKGFCYCLIFACLLLPVGTSARTGLICIALLAVLMLREVKRRVLYLVLLAAVGTAAVPMLPKSYTERMGTIQGYQADESASTRLAVWAWTWDYAKRHPFGGGFAAYIQNNIRYDRKVVAKPGEAAPAAIGTTLTTDKSRAYHSSYFEMLGEQGFPGLAIWLLINLIGLVRMEVLRRRYRDPASELAWAGALAAALQNAHLVYLAGGAFVGIALNPFVFMLIGAQIGLDTYLARRRSEESFRPVRKARPALLPLPA